MAFTLKSLLVKLAVDSTGLHKGLTKAGKSASNTEKIFDRLAKKVAMIAGPAVMGALVVSSTKLAARVETLGIVVGTLGKTADYSELELKRFEEAIKSQGITTRNTLQSMAQMIQANIDLAHGADLARIAQNNAVIANIDSSEAFSRLVDILQSGNVLMGKTLGLNLDFAGSQRALAKELGKTVKELSDAEVMQARLNEVRKAGVAIEGVYEAAMETGGKRMLSLKRRFEELSLALGNLFLPVLGEVIDSIEHFIQFATDLVYITQRNVDEVDNWTEKLESLNMALFGIPKWVNDLLSGIANTTHDLAEETRNLQGPLEDVARAHKTNRVTMEESIIVAGNLVEANQGLVTSLAAVSEAEIAKTLMGELNQQFEDNLISSDEYASSMAWVMDTYTDLTPAEIDARMGMADFKAQLDLTNPELAVMATQLAEITSLFLGLPTRKTINLGMIVSGPAGGAGIGGIPPEGFATFAAGLAAGYEYIEGKWVPERQYGGPVTAGRPYLIHPPEVFIPNVSGRIEPIGQGQAVGGPSVTIENLTVGSDGREIETQMAMEDSLLRVLEELL